MASKDDFGIFHLDQCVFHLRCYNEKECWFAYFLKKRDIRPDKFDLTMEVAASKPNHTCELINIEPNNTTPKFEDRHFGVFHRGQCVFHVRAANERKCWVEYFRALGRKRQPGLPWIVPAIQEKEKDGYRVHWLTISRRTDKLPSGSLRPISRRISNNPWDDYDD